MYSQKYYDRRKFDDLTNGIVVGFDGIEAKPGVKVRIVPKYSSNMLGYMSVDSSGFDNPDLYSCLLIAGKYNGNGFYLRSDNYLEKLPMFCASRYITYNREWTERARIMKSADGAERYTADVANGITEHSITEYHNKSTPHLIQPEATNYLTISGEGLCAIYLESANSITSKYGPQRSIHGRVRRGSKW